MIKKLKHLFELLFSKKKPLMATEVVDEWQIVIYHHQKINLRKSELLTFASLSRFDKRAMADKFKNLEKKGIIKFVTINKKLVCIKNKSYGLQEDI
jgi:hypothetical protein